MCNECHKYKNQKFQNLKLRKKLKNLKYKRNVHSYIQKLTVVIMKKNEL